MIWQLRFRFVNLVLGILWFLFLSSSKYRQRSDFVLDKVFFSWHILEAGFQIACIFLTLKSSSSFWKLLKCSVALNHCYCWCTCLKSYYLVSSTIKYFVKQMFWFQMFSNVISIYWNNNMPVASFYNNALSKFTTKSQ